MKRLAECVQAVVYSIVTNSSTVSRHNTVTMLTAATATAAEAGQVLSRVKTRAVQLIGLLTK